MGDEPLSLGQSIMLIMACSSLYFPRDPLLSPHLPTLCHASPPKVLTLSTNLLPSESLHVHLKEPEMATSYSLFFD